jgi:hypothetical protein
VAFTDRHQERQIFWGERVMQQTNKANAKKRPGKGGRLKAGAAPELRLRTLSEADLLKVWGGAAPTDSANSVYQ